MTPGVMQPNMPPPPAQVEAPVFYKPEDEAPAPGDDIFDDLLNGVKELDPNNWSFDNGVPELFHLNIGGAHTDNPQYFNRENENKCRPGVEGPKSLELKGVCWLDIGSTFT